MLALQLVRPREFIPVEAPDPVVDKPGWIVVRLNRAMVCGSDLPFFSGAQNELDYPLAVGMFIHECTGEVVAGSSDRFFPGDRVVAMPHEDRGLGELFLAAQDEVWKVPDCLNDMELAVLIQPLSTVLFAADKLGPVQGLDILILGAGPIGILMSWVLGHRGARSIRLVDPVRARCEQACRFGAQDAIPATSAEVRSLRRSGLLRWPEPDLCIEAVGHRQPAVNDALALVKKGGRVLALGVPDDPVYAIEYELFFRKNIQLIASVTPDWQDYLARAAELVAGAGHELGPLVTHRFPVMNAADAFALAERRTDGVLKVALDGRTWDQPDEASRQEILIPR